MNAGSGEGKPPEGTGPGPEPPAPPPSELVCEGCGQRIAGEYHLVGEKILCPSCREKIKEPRPKGGWPRGITFLLTTTLVAVLLGMASYGLYKLTVLRKGGNGLPTALPVPATPLVPAVNPSPTPPPDTATETPTAQETETPVQAPLPGAGPDRILTPSPPSADATAAPSTAATAGSPTAVDGTEPPSPLGTLTPILALSPAAGTPPASSPTPSSTASP
jgi:hypothetical protein